MFTWDGEASVNLHRWKRGTSRAELVLLSEAYRGDDGRVYAPAKVLWPWLPRETRAATLALVAVSPPVNTGDAELDELLEGFDDADVAADDLGAEEALDADFVYVSIETSVSAIAAAIRMRRPIIDPYTLEDGDVELVFRGA